MKEEVTRISFNQMTEVLFKLFIKYNFTETKAIILADTFTESTLSGVRSHGINRVPVFLEYIEKGLVNIDAEAEKVAGFGNIERWDGNHGPGIINAVKCTNRAIELAKIHGMGLVALRNTNHWMRGGTYGIQAANAGCISILFTNTQPNMPPWGGKESRIGNNPFVISIPREQGHVVLDMALSQFSFGKINDYKLRGEKLPFFGGWDENNRLSSDPEKILTKERGLPIGFWKGSGLSMVLDMLTTILASGDSTYKISLREFETGISQTYLCINPLVFNDEELQQNLINDIINYTRDVETINPEDKVFFPGEQSSLARVRHLKYGIPVSENIWQKILKLST